MPVSFGRLRAPQGDGQTLIDPPWPTLPEVVAQNREQLAHVRLRCARPIAGRFERSGTPRACCKRAVAYTSQYRDVPERWRQLRIARRCAVHSVRPSAAAVSSGRVVQEFRARRRWRGRLDGVGIHLLIDSDLCRSASIRVPTGHDRAAARRGRAVRRAGGGSAVRRADDSRLGDVQQFAERVGALIRPLVPDPMVDVAVAAGAGAQSAANESWPAAGARPARARRNLAQRHARAAAKRRLPVAGVRLVRGPCAGALAAILVGLQRCAGRVSPRASPAQPGQPVPDLAESDGWLEAPFWIWSADDPAAPAAVRAAIGRRNRHHRPAFAHDFACRCRTIATPAAAAEQLLRLVVARHQDSHAGTDHDAVRPAGAQRLVPARHRRREVRSGDRPDRAAVLRLRAAGVRHGFGDAAAADRCEACDASASRRSGEQRLRELRYHPEQFVDAQRRRMAMPAQSSEIIADKAPLGANAQDAAKRPRAASGIVGANEALQPFVAAAARADRAGARRAAAATSAATRFCDRASIRSASIRAQHFDTLLADPRLV